MTVRARENVPGGSLKYLFVYFKIRIFKCSYRIYIYTQYTYIYILLYIYTSLYIQYIPIYMYYIYSPLKRLGVSQKNLTSVKVATGISSIIWIFKGATIRLSSVVNHPFWVNK